MKVGLVFSKQTGGGHTFITEILDALPELVGESQHTFTVLTPSLDNIEGIRSKFPPSIGVSIFPKPSTQEAGDKFIARRGVNFLHRLLQKNQAATKLNTTGSNQLDQFARSEGIQLIWFLDQQYKDFPDIPYFATLWDLQHRLQPFFPEVEEKGIWEAREAGLSRYLQRAAVVITGSRTAQAEIERFYQVPAERIKILAHPTPKFALEPPTVDAEEVLNRYGLPREYLFYPAQFWAHKNHVNLLLALRILREEHGLTLPMVFVGKDLGNEKYIRQKILELGLSAQVHILGYVSRSDLVALYNKAFALTFVTFFGPDNLPPLEAFAFGCPVIATNVSGAYEQLGDAALLVDPMDPAHIAQAILSLYRNPELRLTLIQRGRERAQQWTAQDFVRGVFTLLDEFEPIRRCWA